MVLAPVLALAAAQPAAPPPPAPRGGVVAIVTASVEILRVERAEPQPGPDALLRKVEVRPDGSRLVIFE